MDKGGEFEGRKELNEYIITRTIFVGIYCGEAVDGMKRFNEYNTGWQVEQTVFKKDNCYVTLCRLFFVLMPIYFEIYFIVRTLTSTHRRTLTRSTNSCLSASSKHSSRVQRMRRRLPEWFLLSVICHMGLVADCGRRLHSKWFDRICGENLPISELFYVNKV